MSVPMCKASENEHTDQGTTLHVGLGLVSNLHDELGIRIDHVLEDGLVDARKIKSQVNEGAGGHTRHPSCPSWRQRDTLCLGG